jgi:hypothetical protein
MKRGLITALTVMFTLTAYSDEGMWLYNQPPRELLKKQYNFDATDEWLDHLQKSSVRFNSGGSGSFVSEDGLLITNHHVGADALQKLSTKDKNYVKDGFFARTQTEEVKCLDLELNVLQSIEDVTAQVNAAVPKGADPDTAFAARRKVIAGIEKDSLTKTGLRSNVITLWKGGAYHLYRFKQYTDVRLVFAPEQQAAFFGGDPDNFEFPRQDLDICLLRAYENGKPANVKDYLHFSSTGPQEGELVFVSGHPGHTNRELIVAELQSMRDQQLPFTLGILKRREVLINAWSQRNEENARRAKGSLFGIQNSRKAFDGRIAGLLDPDLFSAKTGAESDFKAKLSAKPDALAAYDKIAASTRILDAQAHRESLLEGAAAFSCDSFNIARSLLRAGDELPKPNGERLREYTDSEKTSFELALFSEKPIYADFEILKLADALTFLCGELGADDPLVQKILAGKSPRERAAELINGTKVRDVAFRKQLYKGGAQAVSVARDPMIELARLVDADSRALRKIDEDQGEAIEEAHAALDRARNELLGTTGYPDATFTLRLSIGTVKGYEEDGKTVAPITTIGSLFVKAADAKERPPFDLVPSWKKAEPLLDPKTPLNFVSTNDIIGGNSGSPVVNRAAEFVGIIFDGNLQSLSWDEVYGDKQGRAISVDSAAILEALEKVYGMNALVAELKSGKLPK